MNYHRFDVATAAADRHLDLSASLSVERYSAYTATTTTTRHRAKQQQQQYADNTLCCTQ